MNSRDVQTFVEEVARYQILPDTIVPIFAVGLIGMEVAASLLLLIGIQVRIAAGAVALLLGVFIIALVQALLRHLDLTCGCFGGEEPATWWTVGRDAVLLVACLILNCVERVERQAAVPISPEFAAPEHSGE